MQDAHPAQSRQDPSMTKTDHSDDAAVQRRLGQKKLRASATSLFTDGDGHVFFLNQVIIGCDGLIHQHGVIFVPERIEAIRLWRDQDGPFEVCPIETAVVDRDLSGRSDFEDYSVAHYIPERAQFWSSLDATA